jgi:formiminotetrahydrofolate cyclodeaminase
VQSETTIDWLESLAAKQPTPGGGAAAALMAATSAALLSMVSAYTTGPKYADIEKRMQEINDEVKSLRAQALGLMEADAKAFVSVGLAYKMPKNTDAEKAARKTAVHQASAKAAEPPRQTVDLGIRLIEIASELANSSNPNVISDVAVGSAAAGASLESAIVNIEINAKYIDDESTKERLASAVQQAQVAARKASEVTAQVREKINS